MANNSAGCSIQKRLWTLLMRVGELFIDRSVDQSRAPLAGEIRNEPLGENNHSIAEPDEVKDVDETPCKPGWKAAELHFSKHPDRFGLANCRHGSFVKVGERWPLTFREPLPQNLRNKATLLHSWRSKSGERLSFFVHDACGIAQNEDFWMVR